MDRLQRKSDNLNQKAREFLAEAKAARSPPTGGDQEATRETERGAAEAENRAVETGRGSVEPGGEATREETGEERAS